MHASVTSAPAKGSRRSRSPALPALTLNLTSMIDVIFMLLMFFVLTVDFRAKEDSLPMDSTPPSTAVMREGGESGDPFALPERPVIVTVRSLGDGPREYALTTDEPVIGSPAGAMDLRRRAEAARGTTLLASQRFLIRSGAMTRWEHTLAAFNALQRAGYKEVTLAPPAPGGL